MTRAGLTFSKAARHLLRQDPQVLVIGEIRDEETANIAVRAALTGHLVISTLHAGSCRGVFERLLVMCPDHFAVASSAVELVLNQRLHPPRLRRVPAARLSRSCLRTGYKGRVPLVEWLSPDAAQQEQWRAGRLDGLEPARSLRDAASELVKSGITDATEFERIFSR